MPHILNMKTLLSILILSLSNTALLMAAEIKPTICRSELDEKVFHTLANNNVVVVAVCPKKGLYFVEILAKDKNVKDYMITKENLDKMRDNQKRY